MESFLLIRRSKTSIFLDVKETCTVKEVKLMLQGITKVQPQNIRLYSDNVELVDSNRLKDYGIDMSTALAGDPFQIDMVYKNSVTEQWEPLEIVPLSIPPELTLNQIRDEMDKDVMPTQNTTAEI